MSRVFLSHSSLDSREATAVKAWLIEHEPGLAEEIFLDLDPHTGIRPGERWRQALQRANSRCEAVICLLSKHWEASRECQAEFRYAETLNKTILCARLEPLADTGITSEWQRCDLFTGDGLVADIIVDNGEPVRLASDGMQRLLEALRALGIGAEHFPWPPPGDPGRAPYRGWAPLTEADAAVFFGRDAQILRGLDVLHGMRTSGVESLLVILGPSGAGKSSFLRAGLLPRLHRDDRRFLPLPIVRPERAALTGEHGMAQAGVRFTREREHPSRRVEEDSRQGFSHESRRRMSVPMPLLRPTTFDHLRMPAALARGSRTRLAPVPDRAPAQDDRALVPVLARPEPQIPPVPTTLVDYLDDRADPTFWG